MRTAYCDMCGQKMDPNQQARTFEEADDPIVCSDHTAPIHAGTPFDVDICSECHYSFAKAPKTKEKFRLAVLQLIQASGPEAKKEWQEREEEYRKKKQEKASMAAGKIVSPSESGEGGASV